MKQKLIFVSALLTLALLVAACGPKAAPATEISQPEMTEAPMEEMTEAPMEEMTPAVEVHDQEITDGSVTISSVDMAVDGWVVIHTTDADGKPGPVIGHAAAPAGTTKDLSVAIDAEQATPQLFAMLHVDAGVAGTYEFPGDDVPVTNEGAIVMAPFNIEEMATSNEVTIANFSFGPNDLQVKVGTTVTWTNQDSASHTVTADDGSFDSGSLSQGSSFSFTFTEAGTFPYSCNFHPSMVGTVTVVP